MTDHQQDTLLVSRFKLSPDEVAAGVKLRAFARDALGLELHVGQMAFAGVVLARHPANPQTAKFLSLVLASGNRAGKTSLLAAIIIYCCLRKLNKPAPESILDAEKWLKGEYHWYHFGITHEVADLVYSDIGRILSGNHEGQSDGCPMAKAVDGPIAEWVQKENSEYHWIRFAPGLGGAEVHFRTTSEKALGSLGKDMHGISFDEAGIEKNLDFLIKEVFGMRRLGTGGQLIMVSTPSEDIGTFFSEKWEQGDPGSKDRLVSWRSLRMSSRDNIGYGLNQEMFDRLTEDMGPREIAQQIEGIFLQARAAYFNGENVDLIFASGMPESLSARPNGMYLQGCDPAKTQDSMWQIVLKVVENPGDMERPFLIGVNASQKQGQKSTPQMLRLVMESYNQYEIPRIHSQCYTAMDATGFGGKMFREVLAKEIPNIANVEFGGNSQAKKKLLGNLRTVIDEGRLILPRTGIWLSVKRQLTGYKLDDRGIEQDAVMALACCIYLLKRAPVDGVQAVDMPF